MKNLLRPHVVMHCKLGMSSGRKFGATGGNYWNGNADNQHAALLQAIGEMEPEAIPEAVEQSKAWSPAILPADDRTDKVVFNHHTRFQSAAAIADWHGNADSQHAALLQAIGEMEPEAIPEAVEQSKAWSPAILPADDRTDKVVFNHHTHFQSAAAIADWHGNADNQHAALLQAIGEMEPEAIPEAVEQSKAWSPAILPADDRTDKVVFNHHTHFQSAAAIADWHGNADSQHAALLQAIGEMEPEAIPEAVEQSKAWSPAILPADDRTDKVVFNHHTHFQSAAAIADWHGNADSQHAALLQAIGEMEPEAIPEAVEQSKAWSPAILPADDRTDKVVFNHHTHFQSAAAIADWHGNADSQHAALLQAIGEMEPEAIPEAVEQSKAWSPAILPADDRTDKVVFNHHTHFQSAAAIADWHGNADSQHAALLQAIGEMEPEAIPEAVEQSKAWSPAILPADDRTDKVVFNHHTHFQSAAAIADWHGNADSQHAALLQAIGEMEPEAIPEAVEQSKAWSPAILPADDRTDKVVFNHHTHFQSAAAIADWHGNADSQHAALLQAIGEMEPEAIPEAVEQSKAWSPAILPADDRTDKVVFNHHTHFQSAAAIADWHGNADNQHAALLQAIGEMEPEAIPEAVEQSKAWSPAILPADDRTDKVVFNHHTHFQSAAAIADWHGNADNQHAAFLQAIGEMEPEAIPEAVEQSKAWSPAILPADDRTDKVVFNHHTLPICSSDG